MLAPWQALAMAVRMKRLVRLEVERDRHVARVKGLKRKLWMVSQMADSRGIGHTQLRWQHYPTACRGVTT